MITGEEEREEGEGKCHKAFGKSKLVATFQSKTRLEARNKVWGGEGAEQSSTLKIKVWDK